MKTDNLTYENQIILHVSELKSFALKLTKNIADSEDLLSKTILSALENKSKYKPNTNLRAWLYTIMRNFFINDYRRIKRFGYNLEIDGLSNESICIENDIDKKILLDQVLSFLDKQKEQQSIPIIMYAEGYQYDEIAEITNEPIGTVKSRIFKMRGKLNSNNIR